MTSTVTGEELLSHHHLGYAGLLRTGVRNSPSRGLPQESQLFLLQICSSHLQSPFLISELDFQSPKHCLLLQMKEFLAQYSPP